MKVDTNELLRQAVQLETVIRRTAEIRETVLQVARALSRESVGEQFDPALSDVIRQTDSQTRDVAKLRNALEQIAEVYSICENRIVDETENSSILHVFRPPGLIPIAFRGAPDRQIIRLPETPVRRDRLEVMQVIDWTPWDPE